MEDKKQKKDYKRVIITVAAALMAAAAVFLLTVTNAFSALDYMVTDRLYQVPRGVSGQIKIISIDERTLEEYGPINTWSRSRYAELIKILTENEEYEPSVIGLDIQFSGHVDEEGDAALYEAAEEYGRIVTVGQFVYEDMMQRDENGNGFHPVKEFYLPYEELSAVVEVSFSNVSQDSDGTVRRITMENEYKGTKYNSFPYAVYKKYCEQLGTEPAPHRADRYGMSLIDYSGRPGDYEHVSMVDVMEGKIDPRAFAGCIVLVGAYAPGTMDNFNVPTGGSSQMYGVEVHANILQAFMQNRFSINGDPYIFAAIFALVAAVCTFVFSRKKILLSSLALAAGVAAGIVSGVVLHNNGIMVSVIYLPVVLIISYVAYLAESYITEYRNKARILKAFSKYVAPQIINELSSKGNFKVSLGGESKDISVLFVDIRGFTTMSESLQPEEVVAILNQYLALTTKAVFDNMGTLDKFVGDCTMAVFNSPFDLDDYEFKSVCAAFDIASGSERLNEKMEKQFGRKIGFGVGVNCGQAVTGNIGCDFRMDYTAIGDTVNTAARLEANAKAGKVYISDVLYARIKERVDVEEVGIIPLKGKSNGVFVYSVKAVHKDIPAPSPEEMARRRELYCIAGNMPEE